MAENTGERISEDSSGWGLFGASLFLTPLASAAAWLGLDPVTERSAVAASRTGEASGGSLVGRPLASTACQHPPEPPETGGCLSAKPPGAVRSGRQPSDYAASLDQNGEPEEWERG